jgi:hypothetical protein
VSFVSTGMVSAPFPMPGAYWEIMDEARLRGRSAPSVWSPVLNRAIASYTLLVVVVSAPALGRLFTTRSTNPPWLFSAIAGIAVVAFALLALGCWYGRRGPLLIATTLLAVGAISYVTDAGQLWRASRDWPAAVSLLLGLADFGLVGWVALAFGRHGLARARWS